MSSLPDEDVICPDNYRLPRLTRSLVAIAFAALDGQAHKTNLNFM